MRRLRWILIAACGGSLGLAGCQARDAGRPGPPQGETGSGRAELLATLPDDVTPPPAAPEGRLGLHAPPPSRSNDFVFSARGGGVAFVVERREGFQVVHNGNAGKAYLAVGAIALSPDGRRCAHGALVAGRWRMVVDGREGEAFSTVRRPVFSPDGAHVAYQAMAGERWHLVVDGTVNAGTATRILQHEFGGDPVRIAWIDDADDQGTGRLLVSDLAFKAPVMVDPQVSSITVDPTRTRLAAIAAVGRQRRVLALGFDGAAPPVAGAAYQDVRGLSFGPDGATLAYLAERPGQPLLVLGEREAPLPAGAMPIGPLVVRPDGKAVGLLAVIDGAVALRQFFAGGEQAQGAWEEADGLAYGAEGRSVAFAARRGEAWRIVVDGQEGPPFDRAVSPSFSPDGRFLVYRARKDGGRFVVVAGLDGKTIRQLAVHEQVFPVLFTADGRSIAYGVKDGRQLSWKVEAL